MKTVQDKDGNILEVADDTPCHAGKNGALPVMLDKVLDAAIFAEMAEREAKDEQDKLITLPKKLRVEVENMVHNVDGVHIIMDAKTETRLLSTLTSMIEFEKPSVFWKAENGFFELTHAQILNIGAVISGKIAKAFVAENIIMTEINNGTLTTIAEAKARFQQITGQ